jgi:hypothetical protein
MTMSNFQTSRAGSSRYQADLQPSLNGLKGYVIRRAICQGGTLNYAAEVGHTSLASNPGWNGPAVCEVCCSW